MFANIVARLSAFWAKRSKRGKVLTLLIVGALLMCPCCSVLNTILPDPTPTPTASVEAPAGQTSDPQATAQSATNTLEMSRTSAPTRTRAPSNTPEPTSTKAPTRTPRPSNTPVPTADPSEEAQLVQEQVLEIFAPGDAATNDVKEHVQKIADGKSTDMVSLFLLAKEAESAWQNVYGELLSIKPENKDLQKAVDLLKSCAASRRAAYSALQKWIDSGATSDMAEYKEDMEMADKLLIGGLAGIMMHLPMPTVEPTARP